MASKLPPFRPVSQDELRAVYARYRDPDIRRIVLEVERYRRVIAEMDTLYKSTHQAWRDVVGGNLISLHMLLQIMTTERQRLIF